MGRSGLLGAFEEQVLLAVAHLEERAYGMTVRREIEARTSRRVTLGAVYATLDRLQSKGYLSSHLTAGAEDREGLARKMVHLEPEGVNALLRARRLHDKMWEGISSQQLLEAGKTPS